MGAGVKNLPCGLRYNRSEPVPEETGERYGESISIIPRYRLEGALKVGEETLDICLLDLNSDGTFDLGDARSGSSVSLDCNHDGVFRGRGEYLFHRQPFDFAGARYFIDCSAIASDGTSVLVRRLDQAPLEVGAWLPTGFELRLMNGTLLTPKDLDGQWTVLDFWETRCLGCQASMPDLAKMGARHHDTLRVVFCNLDPSTHLEKVKAVLGKRGLRADHVAMSGLGLEDPAWQAFAWSSGVGGFLPAFVLIDPRGQVRYAGHDLEALEQLLAPGGVAKPRDLSGQSSGAIITAR